MPRTAVSLGWVSAFLFLALVTSVGELTAQQPNKDEQLLLQLERDWCTASLKKDASILNRILADDYTSIGNRGTPSTKAEDIASLKEADGLTSCSDADMKVRIYGDAAVVTGLGTRSGTYKGAPFKDRKFYWTDTFIRRNGQWQCVASQGTVIAAQQK